MDKKRTKERTNDTPQLVFDGDELYTPLGLLKKQWRTRESRSNRRDKDAYDST